MDLNQLSGPQRAMYMVLKKLYVWRGDDPMDQLKDAFELELLFIKMKAADDGEFGDAVETCRTTFIDTTLPAPPVRDYEVKAVAQEIADGVFVGWYYLHNGDKPQAFDWINSAFALTATTEEVTTIKYHFTAI